MTVTVLAQSVEKGDRLTLDGDTAEVVEVRDSELALMIVLSDGRALDFPRESVQDEDGNTHLRLPDHHVDIEPIRVGGYICLSREMTWGWGADPAEATAAARKAAGGRGARKGDRVVVRLPEGSYDAYVDGVGMVRWRWTVGADISQSVETVEEPTR